MIKVGITGGIGSGKTTVCKLLEDLNFPVYYADDRAKWILSNNEKCKNQIINLFGAEAYLIDGSVNRAYLSDVVFNSEKNIEILNKIIHPLVDNDFEVWAQSHTQSKFIFKEAALLFETGAYKKLDKIIVVDAPEDIRIKRVLERDDHRTEDQIRKIIKNQLPQEVKNNKADYLIENFENKSLQNQISNILADIKI